MPCYLFTFHAYRSWMPDRSRGFVRRKAGVQPPNVKLAACYERNASEAPVQFTTPIQRLILAECQQACERQKLRLHAAATDTTHVHVLVSWKAFRSWLNMRTGLKSSFTRRLNSECARQTWFSQNSSRKRVVDRSHFDCLRDAYLPCHRGQKWDERTGH